MAASSSVSSSAQCTKFILELFTSLMTAVRTVNQMPTDDDFRCVCVCVCVSYACVCVHLFVVFFVLFLLFMYD